ncbi:DUF4442 domain-containing protein [Denitratisoma sp. agr-D3]
MAKLPPRWQAWMMKVGFNFHPAFRGTGGRVEYVSPALDHIRIRLPLTWRTRNVVGSIYGGSLFAITDGPHPSMLMVALGKDVIVWDKAASIRYRKPGHSTLTADFRITPEEVDTVRRILAEEGETDRTYTVEIKDRGGHVHAIVERTVYIAAKHHYKKKKSGGGSP